MNSFEQRQEERRERFEARADKARAESAAAYNASRKALSGMEMGQPILVGHHSEKRHRNDIKRADNAMRKSCQLDDKAQHYDRKAAGVGTGGISSDDPDAIEKLKEQLSNIQKSQETMKAANLIIRKRLTDAEKIKALINLGLNAASANALLIPDFCGRLGFASYSLQNNSANGRRLELRIKELEKRRNQPTLEDKTELYTYKEDPEDNRILFIFDGKPSDAVRAVLKSNGFKWSPSRPGKPWVRQLNNSGKFYAGCVKAKLAEIEAGG